MWLVEIQFANAVTGVHYDWLNAYWT